MLRNKTRLQLMASLLVWGLAQLPSLAGAAEIGDVVAFLSGRLERGQLDNGMLAGAWPGEEAHTGSMVASLVHAYELTCEESHKLAAVSGGDFILEAAAGNYYGDEAYALACLSRIDDREKQNLWRAALAGFYRNVRELAEGSTAGYISQFDQTELSRAIFYLANHTIAAFYVGAEDKGIWRSGLLRFLARVDDDTTGFPMAALGVATWALAKTGPLDDSLVDLDGEGVAYWRDKTLANLPTDLLGHQVSEGDLAGSFYWRFDHGDGGQGVVAAGYVEDLAFGALGLVAVGTVIEDPRIDEAIVCARNAFLDAIGEDGVVPEHLWYGGDGYMVYTAYALRALTELAAPADLNLRGGVDAMDLAVLAARWRDEDFQGYCSCDRTDINRDGHVDVVDLQILTDSWLEQ